MSSKYYLLQKLPAALCCSVFLWIMGYLLFLALITTTPTYNHAKIADAIVVVTGGIGRIDAGLDLLAAGYAQNLLISGVDRRVSLSDIYDVWGSNNDAVQCCITLDYLANNTKENAEETKKWVSKNGYNSLILVTSNYHMPRAQMEFYQQMPDISTTYHPVQAYEIRQSGLNFLFITFVEYNKSILIFLQHHLMVKI